MFLHTASLSTPLVAAERAYEQPALLNVLGGMSIPECDGALVRSLRVVKTLGKGSFSAVSSVTSESHGVGAALKILAALAPEELAWKHTIEIRFFEDERLRRSPFVCHLIPAVRHPCSVDALPLQRLGLLDPAASSGKQVLLMMETYNVGQLQPVTWPGEDEGRTWWHSISSVWRSGASRGRVQAWMVDILAGLVDLADAGWCVATSPPHAAAPTNLDHKPDTT